jgi:hypothetical protein
MADGVLLDENPCHRFQPDSDTQFHFYSGPIHRGPSFWTRLALRFVRKRRVHDPAGKDPGGTITYKIFRGHLYILDSKTEPTTTGGGETLASRPRTGEGVGEPAS